MFCPKCGTQNPDGSRYCKGCGAPLGVQPATGQHAGAPAPGAAPMSDAAPMPDTAPTSDEKPWGKVRPPVIAIVATVVAVLVVGFATSWFGLRGSGLKAGTYSLKNSGGNAQVMLSAHEDGVVGATIYEEGIFEGKSKSKTSHGHVVVTLSDSSFAMPSRDVSVSLILPSGLDKGPYAGDYAFRISGTGSSDSHDEVTWMRLGDDGNVYESSYSSGGSSEDPNAVFDSIANGSWSDDQAQQVGTWRANDGDNVGFGIYDTSGKLQMTGTFEAYE